MNRTRTKAFGAAAVAAVLATGAALAATPAPGETLALWRDHVTIDFGARGVIRPPVLDPVLPEVPLCDDFTPNARHPALMWTLRADLVGNEVGRFTVSLPADWFTNATQPGGGQNPRQPLPAGELSYNLLIGDVVVAQGVTSEADSFSHTVYIARENAAVDSSLTPLIRLDADGTKSVIVDLYRTATGGGVFLPQNWIHWSVTVLGGDGAGDGSGFLSIAGFTHPNVRDLCPAYVRPDPVLPPGFSVDFTGIPQDRTEEYAADTASRALIPNTPAELPNVPGEPAPGGDAAADVAEDSSGATLEPDAGPEMKPDAVPEPAPEQGEETAVPESSPAADPDPQPAPTPEPGPAPEPAPEPVTEEPATEEPAGEEPALEEQEPELEPAVDEYEAFAALPAVLDVDSEATEYAREPDESAAYGVKPESEPEPAADPADDGSDEPEVFYDEHGRRVDADGYLVDEDGNRIEPAPEEYAGAEDDGA